MPELERDLRLLASEIEWPPTPPLSLRLEPQRPAVRPRLLLVAAAVLVLALAVALSVPSARSAILRFFHLGGVTIQRVNVLPPARERPLSADLGPAVSEARARAALGAPVRLPDVRPRPPLHLRGNVVSVILAAPRPVLLSEFPAGEGILKKFAGNSTTVRWLTVGRVSGLWITGGEHVLQLPGSSPRLAGNSLLWQHGTTTYRLEGRGLSLHAALRLAREIEGT
jgi:hypothetical protein